MNLYFKTNNELNFFVTIDAGRNLSERRCFINLVGIFVIFFRVAKQNSDESSPDYPELWTKKKLFQSTVPGKFFTIPYSLL